jgi:hypothetical protein
MARLALAAVLAACAPRLASSAPDVVDIDVRTCGDHGVTLPLPSLDSIVRLVGIEESDVAPPSPGGPLFSFLAYHAYEWAEVRLTFVDRSGSVIDPADLVLGLGNTSYGALGDRERGVAGAAADYGLAAARWIMDPFGILSNGADILSSAPAVVLNETAAALGVEGVVGAAADAARQASRAAAGLLSGGGAEGDDGLKHTPHLRANPYQTRFVAVRPVSPGAAMWAEKEGAAAGAGAGAGGKDGRKSRASSSSSSTSRLTAPLNARCSINFVALRFPALLLVGVGAYTSAEALAHSPLVLYGGGTAFGVAFALGLLVVFLYRNRHNKAILTAGALSALFGGAATMWREVGFALLNSLGLRWLAPYWPLLGLLYVAGIVYLVLTCCIKVNRPPEEARSVRTATALALRIVGAACVYNSFNTQSASLAAVALICLPVYLLVILERVEGLFNSVVGLFVMGGCCCRLNPPRLALVRSVRRLLGIRRSPTLAALIIGGAGLARPNLPPDADSDTEGDDEVAARHAFAASATPASAGGMGSGGRLVAGTEMASTTPGGGLDANTIRQLIRAAGRDETRQAALADLLAGAMNAQDGADGATLFTGMPVASPSAANLGSRTPSRAAASPPPSAKGGHASVYDQAGGEGLHNRRSMGGR